MLKKSETTGSIEPAECGNMAEVRAGVDCVDQALIALLGRRFAYMDAAARIKTERDAVRDEARKAQVMENICLGAANSAVPVEVAEALWEQLIEASIAYEFEQWDVLRR